MTTAIIITICSLLLLAYIFDISSALTKIPSVILLLILGWVVRQATYWLQIPVPDLNPLLPILGTFGLVLIVLEGSLELELNRTKIPVIRKSSLNALIPMLILAFGLAFAFQYYEQVSLKTGLINAIPFCIISSAIAIPSARILSKSDREFVIYESSLSDIFGILFFNFIAMHEIINFYSFTHLLFQILIITLISFVSVLGLSLLLSRNKHYIAYSPIILLVILIYAISKVYHLPGLIFILIFGLFLGNLDELKNFKWMERFRPEILDNEVVKFKAFTGEVTFLVRALFFLLFGFLMESGEILNMETMPWAFSLVVIMLFIRSVGLKISGMTISPLLYISPRGLITIILFLSIAPEQAISIANKSLVIQVIVLTVLVMIFGLMTNKRKECQVPSKEK